MPTSPSSESRSVRSRFQKALSGRLPNDRLPVFEWATWWDKTIARWRTEGLPLELDGSGIKQFFGQDLDYQLWISPVGDARPLHEETWIVDEQDYDGVRAGLYPDRPVWDGGLWASRANEDAVLWVTFDGFFWWPRVLFGIEQHLYAFYDYPELMHKINRDQADYMLRCLDRLPFCPDFMTFAEDMSYNHGPMLSKDLFDEFLAPYYRQVVPELKRRGIVPIVDSDGDVESMIPWLEEVGIEGILPLERRAGVDVARIRQNHPRFLMIGAFDKTVMALGEAAMREEFERLLPVMRTGGFLPSVDHQTPPDVSLDDYRRYLCLLREYAEKACRV